MQRKRSGVINVRFGKVDETKKLPGEEHGKTLWTGGGLEFHTQSGKRATDMHKPALERKNALLRNKSHFRKPRIRRTPYHSGQGAQAGAIE